MTFINSAESLQSPAELSPNNLHLAVGLCIYITATLQGIKVREIRHHI